MLLTGLTEEQIAEVLKEQTEERTVHFWGYDYQIKPQLVDWQMGDGLRLVTVTPLATRPNYYIVRIDSKSNFNDEEYIQSTDPGNGQNIVEDVIDLIEEQFGYYCGDGDLQDFPVFDETCGYGYQNLEP